MIEDGKIASHVWTLTEDSAFRLKTAMAEAVPAEEEGGRRGIRNAREPVSEISIVITGGMCNYEGPLTLQPGPVQVTLDVPDAERDAYGLIFFTLDPDKDFMDLMASTTGGARLPGPSPCRARR